MAIDTNGKRHRKPGHSYVRLTQPMAADTIAGVKRDTLGQRLRIARKTREYKTNELTRLVRLPDGSGLSEGYISSVERRRADVPATYALALAEALHIRVEWLVKGTGPMEIVSGPPPATEATPKPHLERVLAAMNVKGRWGEEAVAAARAMRDDRELSEWPALLDRLERGIRAVLGETPGAPRALIPR